MSDSATAVVDPAWWSPGFRDFSDAELMLADGGEGTHREVHIFTGGLQSIRGGAGGRPQGYLVHMVNDERVGAHFHRADQFQIFFGADGALYQRTSINPGSVLIHYTDAFATYGPFSSGDHGLDLFTLRAAGDGFTGWMPGARQDLPYRGKRTIEQPIQLSDCSDLPEGETATSDVIPMAQDGLACFLIRGGSGSEVVGLNADNGGGQYYCVLSGELAMDGRTFGRQSLAWVAPGGAPLVLDAASDSGFEVVVVQFPKPPTPLQAGQRS